VSTYPYASRDLFAEPETYFYAPAAEPDFLQGWDASRASAVERLSRVTAEDEVGVDATCPGAVAARDIFSDCRRLDPAAAWFCLRPFARKFEMFRRLFTHYEPVSLRRHPLASPAPLELYVAFAECLAACGRSNLQALSTLLKLCDALCATPAAAPWTRSTASRLSAVIRLERVAVMMWQ
jgi:hypothetical protein